MLLTYPACFRVGYVPRQKRIFNICESRECAMKMSQVHYFLAVSECESFTKAAALCNVAQPALSRAVSALEAELGVKLFRRGHTRSLLTDIGRAIRPRLKQIREQEKA